MFPRMDRQLHASPHQQKFLALSVKGDTEEEMRSTVALEWRVYTQSLAVSGDTHTSLSRPLQYAIIRDIHALRKPTFSLGFEEHDEAML